MKEFFTLRTANSLSAFNLSELLGDNDVRTCFTSISQLSSLHDGSLSYFDGSSLPDGCNSMCMGLILVKKSNYELASQAYPCANLIIVHDPRAMFLDIVNQCIERDLLCLSSLFPKFTTVSQKSLIGKNVVIEDGVHIDDGVVIGSGSVVKKGSWLKNNVVVGENTVIGGVGINLHVDKQTNRRMRFPHIGGVIVEHGSSIGSNCVVVRGTLTSTLIGPDVIISNLCNVGHCVSILSQTWLSSGVIVGGYCSIGARVNVGLGAVIKNNLLIGDDCNVGMGSVVIKSVAPGESVFGNPAKKVRFLQAGPN